MGKKNGFAEVSKNVTTLRKVSGWKWMDQNFLVKSTRVLVVIIGILIDIIRIFWFLYFQPDIFLRIETNNYVGYA